MRQVEYIGRAYEVSDAHPAADELPWDDDGDNFADLVASVRAGFDPERPVVRQAGTGLVIGGRRRELACRVAGVNPVYKDVDWDDATVIGWVKREDLLRRNLTESQRAMIVVGLNRLLPQGRPDIQTDKSGNISGLSQDQLAAEAGTTDRTIRDAVKVAKKATPEVAEAVREGKLSAHAAAKVADLPKSQQKKIAAAADPKKAAKAATAKPKPATEPETTAGIGPAAADPTPAQPARDDFAFGANATEPEPDTPDAFVGRLQKLCVGIDRFKAEVAGLSDSAFSKHVHAESVTNSLEVARKALWQSRPTEPCPVCDPKVFPGYRADCRLCFGTGRSTAARTKNRGAGR